MSDEKNLNNEELNEEVNEAVNEAVAEAEEVVEAVEAEVEEVIEEAAEEVSEVVEATEEVADEEMSEIDRAIAEAMAERDMQEMVAKAKKSKKVKLVAGIVAAVVVVAGAVASGFIDKGADGSVKFNTYGGWLPKLVNKYNHMGYIDVTGRNVGDVAESLGIEVADFLEMYGLPADMGASTSEMAALYNMPAKNYAEMYGIDFASIKELMNVPETTEDGEAITEDTPWGIVEGELTVGDYTQGDLDSLKEMYDLGDEITLETKWKNVRPIIDEKSRQDRIASEKGKVEEDVTADVAEDVAVEEVPAEDVPAEAEGEVAAETEATAE